MTRTTLALIAGLYGFVLAIIFMSLFDYFRKGGTRALNRELDAEVELNVKLLKEKYDWILERAKFRRTMRDPIKLADILELAKMIDASIPKDLSASSADCCPAPEDAGVVSENARASVPPVLNCDLCYLHIPHVHRFDDV